MSLASLVSLVLPVVNYFEFKSLVPASPTSKNPRDFDERGSQPSFLSLVTLVGPVSLVSPVVNYFEFKSLVPANPTSKNPRDFDERGSQPRSSKTRRFL